MQPFRHLPITQDFVAVFASGPSVNSMSVQELSYIRSRCFTITLNYAPVRLESDLNIWSDRRVGHYLAERYSGSDKDRLFVTQKSHTREFDSLADYYFDRRADGLAGNFTLVWLLQLLRQHFNDKQILLFGADFHLPPSQPLKWYDAFTDHDRAYRGAAFDPERKLDQCAVQLQSHCASARVINCTPGSALSVFEQRDWRDVLPLNVLHLTQTPLAGAPAHLSRILNRYTPHRSRCVLRMTNGPNRRSNLWWNYDISGPSQTQLDSEIDRADLVHMHGKPYPVELNGKPSLLQYHTPPGGYRPLQTHGAYNGRKLVIAQYHPRFYRDARIVPNLIDIHDAEWRPEPKSDSTVTIFYSWATEKPGGWSDKGSRETRRILDRLANRYQGRLKVIVKTDRPYAECMAAKRGADICIDECVTGSYHIQSLEGCAVGAATFNAIDETTAGFVRQVTGTGDHPFQVSGLADLEHRLIALIEDRTELRRQQAASRTWMEAHWAPEIRVRDFVRAYYDVLLDGSLGDAPAGMSRSARPRLQSMPSQVRQARARSDSPVHRPDRPFAASARPLATAPPNVRLPRSHAPIPHVSQRRASVRESAETRPSTVPASHHPIEQLHKRFAGRDILVLGCGPSLQSLDMAPYRDHLVLGVNFAFEKVERVDFNLFHAFEPLAAARGALDPGRLILPATLVRRPGCGDATERVPTAVPGAYIYPLQNPSIRDPRRKTVGLERSARILSWTSVAHSAIHLAAYMGARAIVLEGMDCRPFPDGRVHFDTPLMPEYGEQAWSANAKHAIGIDWVSQQLRAQGIQVERPALVG